MHLHTILVSSIALLGLSNAVVTQAGADSTKPPGYPDGFVASEPKVVGNVWVGPSLGVAPAHVPLPPRFKPLLKHAGGGEPERVLATAH